MDGRITLVAHCTRGTVEAKVTRRAEIVVGLRKAHATSSSTVGPPHANLVKLISFGEFGEHPDRKRLLSVVYLLELEV